ncbi:MAG: PilZ domain-containing protein [Proteobacteria bacterium]|nr:PilZ domain-containing protein [Pseudomonadota bacterium]
MEESRRSQRHAKRLRAVIILDENGKLAKTHGKTQDVSTSGASIISDYNLLSPHPITVCLLINPGDQINPPVIFEAKSKIVSSVLSRQQGGFRIGVEFLKIAGDGAQVLHKFLATSVAAVA